MRSGRPPAAGWSSMVERVVVGVNGSAGSRAALAWALHRAATVPMSLDITTVIDLAVPERIVPAERISYAYEQVLAEASAMVEQLRPDIEVVQHLRRGDPVDALRSAADDADLLVLGTREPTGYFTGTLRHRLAAYAGCTVVVVPAGWEPSSEGDEVGDGAVVVGVDRDGSSDAALAFATAEATRMTRPLDVVHVWHLPVALTALWLSVGQDPVVEIGQEERGFLDGVVDRIRAEHEGLEVTGMLERGSAAAALTDIASNAALLVVGRHPRGPLPAFLLGSVGHDLLVSMPCPVAIVRNPQPAA